MPRRLRWILLSLVGLLTAVNVFALDATDPVADSLRLAMAEEPDFQQKAEISFELSRHFRKSNLDSSDKYIKNAIRLAEKSGNKDRMQRFLMSKGSLKWMQYKLDSAAMLYEEALNYFQKTGNELEATRCLLNLGSVMHSWKKPDKAIQYATQGLEKARALDEKQMEAQSNGNLANIYFHMGMVDSTAKYGAQTIGIFTETNDSANLARAHSNMGYYLRESGQSNKARPYYLQALKFLEGTDEMGLKGEIHEGLGTLEIRIGNFEEAVNQMLISRTFFKELGWDARFAENTNAIGWSLKLLGRNEAAREYFEEAYHLADSVEATNQAASALSNLAWLEREAGRYQEAIRLYRKVLDMRFSFEDDVDNFEHFIGLGISFKLLNQQDSASFYIDKALEIARAKNDQYRLGNGFIQLGEMALESKHWQDCATYADSAIKWMNINQHPRGLFDAWSLKSSCLEKMGDFVGALAAQRTASSWRDSVFSSSATESLLGLEAELWSEKKQHSLDLAQKNQELQAKEAARAREESEKFASQRNLLVIILVLLLISGSGFYYLNRRHRESRMQRKLTEMRMRALQAQMNPHFIFNALGSVQLLINTQNVREANQYLTKFARLLRKILERSTEPETDLEAEIEALTLYVELEALRFKFHYEFEVADDISPFETVIPGMVIQPFVENAIKHGISGMETHGKLKISFEKKGEELICAIEDNGMGREKAGQKKQSGDHLSMSTQIVEERLGLLRPVRNDRLQITDLHDADGQPTGTRVTLIFPLSTSKS